jgi:hypothetical protein
LNASIRGFSSETLLYACEIEKTTNGGWRSAVGQTWSAFREVTSRRIEKHVQIDEPKGTSPRGQDQAQEVAD